MEIKDAENIIMAVSVLKNFNEKYGCPHGENPIGIAIEALKVLKKEPNGRKILSRKKIKQI